MTLAHEPARADLPVALVTGGGSGIGASTARLLARTGWQVVITGRRREALESVATASGIDAFPADVSDAAAVKRLVGDVLSAYGRLDGLVSNAGAMAVGSVAETGAEAWQRLLDVNLTATFHLAKAALPALREARGSIVVVGSIAALRNSRGAAAYSVSKAAVAMLARAIAVDEAANGVRANVVHPGWVRTEMADAEMDGFGDACGMDRESAYAAITSLVPQERPADSEEIAAAIGWLLGPDSSYVTGAELVVDGGTTLVDAGTVPFWFDVRPRA